MKTPLLALLALPYSRLELPGWGKVLRLAGVFDDGRWARPDTRTVRGKFHGYEMKLDLSNWSERRTYFLGRFYELSTQLFVREFVRPGDTFIDAGANIGMITLLAARCAGPAGRVYSFEPNPVAFRRLRDVVTANGLEQVIVHELGLGDRPGELVLNVLLNHTGMGTLGEIPDRDKDKVTDRYTVKVVRGDDVLSPPPPGPAMIKIDVEGFECHVLRGLRDTIERLKPAVVTEALPGNLRRAGSSIGELVGIMREHGYEAYDQDIAPSGLRYRLSLKPSKGGEQPVGDNLAFFHADSAHGQRLKEWQAAMG